MVVVVVVLHVVVRQVVAGVSPSVYPRQANFVIMDSPFIECPPTYLNVSFQTFKP